VRKKITADYTLPFERISLQEKLVVLCLFVYETQNSYKYIAYFEPVIHMQIYIAKLFEEEEILGSV
jgi:hypothetical protein